MTISSLDPSNTNNKTQTPRPEQTPAQQQKTELNIAILESSEATIGAKDQPLALLLRTAIDNLNDLLAPELGENAIQNAASSGIDFSPEATADRIVSLSTGFYELFKEQHNNEDEAEVLDKFMATIGKGIERGFNEAREILAGLNVLEGDIARTIDETYALVQQGLTAFEAQFKEQEEQD